MLFHISKVVHVHNTYTIGKRLKGVLDQENYRWK